MTPEELKKEFAFIRTELQSHSKLMEFQKTVIGLMNARLIALIELQAEILTADGADKKDAQTKVKASFEAALKSARAESETVYSLSTQNLPPPASDAGRN